MFRHAKIILAKFEVDMAFCCWHLTCPCDLDLWPWRVNRGQKQLHVWNPRPQFANSLQDFYGVAMMIKGRFIQVSLSNVKVRELSSSVVQNAIVSGLVLCTLAKVKRAKLIFFKQILL